MLGSANKRHRCGLSNRSLKDDAIAEILLFGDSDNDLIPLDSSYMKYAQYTKTLSNEVDLPKIWCPPPPRDA
jgi:hypothetical protein